MIRNFLLSAVAAAFVVALTVAAPSGAQADTASDIAAILADATLTAEEIAVQVAELVTNADDPSAAAAAILAAAANATETQSEGVGLGLGRAVLALQLTDAGEASEVAAEVVSAPAAIQAAFTTETGSTAAVLSASTGESLLGNESGDKSSD